MIVQVIAGRAGGSAWETKWQRRPMSLGRPPPLGVRAARGRPRDPGVDAAIRAATVDLLGDAGYARLTMDQVATRARVSKSSLYLRWPNKVALVADALQHRARAVPEVPDTGSLPGTCGSSSPGCCVRAMRRRGL